MSHPCSCKGHDAAPAGDRTARTVADVSSDPRALEVLQRFGINHCCGAHLSLAEAAAAAGVPIAALLRALDDATVPA